MATVIDALLVTLGLDATGYKRGQKEVQDANRKLSDEEQKQAKEQQARQKAAVEGFRAIRNEILTIVSAALGGKALKDFMADATATNRQLGINARNLGMSASRLKAWQDAAKAAGGTAEGLTNSMQGLAQAIEQHQQGNPTDTTRMLARMGVNFQEKDIEKLTLDVIGALDRIGKQFGPQTQIFAANALGIDPGTLELMRRGREGVAQLVNGMAEHTKSSNDAAQASGRLTSAWGDLSNRAGDLGNRIYVALVPALEAASTLLTKILETVLKVDESTGGWTIRIGALSFALVGLAAGLRTVFTIGRGLLALMGGSAAAGAGAAAKGGASAAAAAAGGGLLARLAWLFKGGVGLSALTYSGSLNANEDAELARIRGEGGQAAPKSFSELESKWGLPAGMLDKIWAIESNRGQNMVSPAGATGHFQFMPGTAKQYGLSREDTFDLGKSSEGAARYLADLLKKYSGDTDKALAAYNWGMGNVDRQGLANAPLETINYIKKYNNMGSGRGGNTTTSETHIQSLTVNTQVTDAQGFARELPAALGANSLVPNFATGVN